MFFFFLFKGPLTKLSQILVVLRHAERIDRCPGHNSYVGIPNNPTLSPKGHDQALAVGALLAVSFPNATWTVCVSPFLRTIQTAGHIMRRNQHTGTLHVDYGLCEHLEVSKFPESLTRERLQGPPIHHALGLTEEECNINFLHTELPQYHEPIVVAYERFNGAMARLSRQQFPRASHVLFVTHGYAHVAVIRNVLGHDTPVRKVALCSFIVLQRSSETDGGGNKGFTLRGHPGVELGIESSDHETVYEKYIEEDRWGGSLLSFHASGKESIENSS